MAVGNFQTGIANLVTSISSADKVNIDRAFFEESFLGSDITRFFDVRTGVRDGEQTPVIGRQIDLFQRLPASASNGKTCTMNTGTLTTDYSLRKWSLGEYNERVPICLATLDDDFLVFWNMYRQRLNDPLETPDAQAYLDFLLSKITTALDPVLWRISMLGDKTSTLTGANLISNNNGILVQAQAGGGEQIKITQPTPTGEQLYGYMKQAYDWISQQFWFDDNEFVWDMDLASASLLIKMLNDANDQSQYNCTCIDPHQIAGRRFFTVNNFTMFGLPVRVHREIDMAKLATGDTSKYEILLSRRGDVLIGTETLETFKDFDIFFDRLSKNIYIEAMINAGAMLATDDYVYISTNVA